VMQTGKQHGMITFEGAMQDLIHKGLISKEDGANFLRRRNAGSKNLPGTTPPAGIRLAPNVASN
jgi:Tfp pilus assembly pilus retraction ATPase PilT